MSDAAVGFDFEQLEPSEPPPRDAPARLLAQARAQAEELRTQAHADGYAEGLHAGRTAAADEAAAALRALGDATRRIHALRDEVVEAVERDALALALQLARELAEGARAARADAVLEVVRGALQRIADRREIVVLLNPADRAALDGAALDAAGVERCEVHTEEHVQRGCAVVRTREGEVDASVPTQLARARAVVEAALAPAGHDV